MLENLRFPKISEVTIWLDTLEDRNSTYMRIEIKYVYMSFQKLTTFICSFIYSKIEVKYIFPIM